MSALRKPVPATDMPAALEQRLVADLRPHPQAGQVPPLDRNSYSALQTDIAERGVQVPLEINHEGIVVDGHARLQIAVELVGIRQLDVVVVTVENELEHILRRALLRQHLTASQQAALAVKLLPFEQIREQAAQRQQANLRQNLAERAMLPARERRSRDQVAQLSGAGARTVQDAITVHQHNPELFERVVKGEISANTAARQVRRAHRDAAIPPPPPPPEGPFQLILADPPWQMGSPDSPRAPEQHYPCLSLDQIKTLPVPAAENAILLVWAVNSLLPEALDVIAAWDFTYKTNLVWDKGSIGPGVWLRQQHELLLIATRGTLSPPLQEDRVSSVLTARRGRHSEKPAAVYELIERMYPDLSKLELFARGTPQPGWQNWGNQAEPAEAS